MALPNHHSHFCGLRDAVPLLGTFQLLIAKNPLHLPIPRLSLHRFRTVTRSTSSHHGVSLSLTVLCCTNVGPLDKSESEDTHFGAAPTSHERKRPTVIHAGRSDEAASQSRIANQYVILETFHIDTPRAPLQKAAPNHNISSPHFQDRSISILISIPNFNRNGRDTPFPS